MTEQDVKSVLDTAIKRCAHSIKLSDITLKSSTELLNEIEKNHEDLFTRLNCFIKDYQAWFTSQSTASPLLQSAMHQREKSRTDLLSLLTDLEDLTAA